MMLEVGNLSVAFETRRGRITVIEDLSLKLAPGRTLGIVGESGSGKSVTSLALMGLLPPNARVTTGKVEFQGRDLLKAPEAEMRKLRGGELAMIFQDPMTSLNPSFTVGYQLKEALRIHGLDKGNLDTLAVELLKQVGIPDPAMRLDSYPHQLSGGMSQRVMIAMAIACSPKLLIADEPTTALDVTIQAQILSLLKKIQRDNGMSLILITHDIGVVAQMADDILVMYAGHAMEYGPKEQVIRHPRHPYTQALLAALPGSHSLAEFRSRLPTIPGLVPDLLKRPSGCQLNPRCPYATDLCRTTLPSLNRVGDTLSKCHWPLNDEGRPTYSPDVQRQTSFESGPAQATNAIRPDAIQPSDNQGVKR